MNNDGVFDETSFKLLHELTKEPIITQRVLSVRLNIALGLTNAYLKRLYKKGCIKIKNLPRNRIKYIITPKGLAEKAKLTYSYMHRSIDYFREMRQRIESAYSLMMTRGVKNILLWGDGEIAELCYISTRGLPLKIIGVVDSDRKENGFFGQHIYPFSDVKDIDYDAILVSSIEDKMLEKINELHINPEKIYYL